MTWTTFTVGAIAFLGSAAATTPLQIFDVYVRCLTFFPTVTLAHGRLPRGTVL
jgi:hypothetical protein